MDYNSEIYNLAINSNGGKRDIRESLMDLNKRLKIDNIGSSSYIPLMATPTTTSINNIINNSNSLYNNNNNSGHKRRYSYTKSTTEEVCLFENLSVEIIVKIFSYCDPFSTPLLFVCRLWSRIIHSNQLSIWRNLFITISENRPHIFRPLGYRIISYFKNGYGRALHSFSLITSLSPTNNNSNNSSNKQINSVNNRTNINSSNSNINSTSNNNNNIVSSRSSNNSIQLNNSNSNINSENNNRYQNENRSISRSPTETISKSINSSNNNNNNNNNSVDKINLAEFVRCLGEGLAECSNLRHLDLSIPLDTDQLNLITSNCPRLTELNFNSLLISDKGIESALTPLTDLEQLSVVSTSQVNSEFIKQTGRQLNSSMSPLSLYSISTLKSLKSLKFSLLPQFGNKSLVESGIVSEQSETSNSEHQADIEKAVKSLSNCKLLENLELMSCNINETTLQTLLEKYSLLNRLVIYRNSSLNSFYFKPSTITHLSLSCLSMLQTIFIESKTLQELYIEGCESLKSTELITPSLNILSIEGCTGTLNLRQAFNIKTLSLFECTDFSQKDLENTLDSLLSLEELYIYLHQIADLRICSQTLRKLDIEAWSGIRSCIMDCPELEEFKASESSLESLYLKADHLQTIELDFCDQLRSAVIDILSCRLFSFTQNHPTTSNHKVDLSSFNLSTLTNNDNDDIIDDDDNKPTDLDINTTDVKYLAPMVLFLQAHHFIKDCIILSGNLLGKLSTRTVGQLSIEQRSFSSYIFNVDKICKLNTYHQSRSGKSGNRTPRFIPIESESTSYLTNSGNITNGSYDSDNGSWYQFNYSPPSRKNSLTRSIRPQSPNSRAPSPSSFYFPSMETPTSETESWQPTFSYFSPISPSLSFNNRNNKRYGQS